MRKENRKSSILRSCCLWLGPISLFSFKLVRSSPKRSSFQHDFPFDRSLGSIFNSHQVQRRRPRRRRRRRIHFGKAQQLLAASSKMSLLIARDESGWMGIHLVVAVLVARQRSIIICHFISMINNSLTSLLLLSSSTSTSSLSRLEMKLCTGLGLRKSAEHKFELALPFWD